MVLRGCGTTRQWYFNNWFSAARKGRNVRDNECERFGGMMGSRGGAQKIPTNRPKHLHPARAVTAASFQQYAACQSRIQRQWTSSTTSSVLTICSTRCLGDGLCHCYLLFHLEAPACSALLCSASTLPKPDVLTCCLGHTLTLLNE